MPPPPSTVPGLALIIALASVAVFASNETSSAAAVTSAPTTTAATARRGTGRVLRGDALFATPGANTRFASETDFFAECASAAVLANSLSFAAAAAAEDDVLSATVSVGVDAARHSAVLPNATTLGAVADVMRRAGVHVTWTLLLVNRAVLAEYVRNRAGILDVTSVTVQSSSSSGGGGDASVGSSTNASSSSSDNGSGVAPTAARVAEGTSAMTRISLRSSRAGTAATGASAGSGSGSNDGSPQGDSFVPGSFPPPHYGTICTDIPSLRSQTVASLPTDLTTRSRSEARSLSHSVSWSGIGATLSATECSLVLTRCIWSSRVSDAFVRLAVSNASASAADVRALTRLVWRTKAVTAAATVSLAFNVALPLSAVVGSTSLTTAATLRSMLLVELCAGSAYFLVGISMIAVINTLVQTTAAANVA
jgi:hypothetical protein